MTIKIDQIADAIISAPGSTIKVLDFIPVSDVTTSSLTFVEVTNGLDRAGTYFGAPVSGSYVFSVDLDSITSGATDTAIYFRLVVDKGTLNEKIVSPDLGSWTQIHTTVSIHRQLSFMSPPVVLNSGSHTIVLEWSVSNGSATARMTGAYSYVYINALSSGASGAGGILLDSYSIIAGNATYNSTNWTDILIQVGGSPLQISFDAIINESVGVNVALDAYNYINGAAPRYADFRLLLDNVEEIAWARQRFNNSIAYEELISLMAYIPSLTKGPHIIKAQVKVENSDMSIAFMNGDSRGKLELIRFRGGLVPIQKDGITITSVPSALNFKGTNLNLIDTTGIVDFDFYKASSICDGYLSRSDWALFNGKITDVMTARGDLIYRNSSNITDRLQLGANGFILASNGLDAIWKAVPAAHDPVSLSSDAYNGGLRLSGQELSLQIANSTYDGYLSKNDWTLFNGKLTDPMSIRGDLVYRNSSNVTTRLPVGADGYVLTSNGTDVVWSQPSNSGAITTDTIYYVDGDNGNDISNGLSWLTAKKTMAFLYSGDSDAIPREINANVIVRCRGVILSKTASRHTVLDNFYGSGSITVEGEMENVVTGLHPTGWDNTTTNVTYHSYIQVNGTAWAIDAYKGMFIQFTSPVSDTMYPISNSSASRLETIGLPDIVGTETFKIIQSSAIWRGATVADPVTLVEYGGVDGEFSVFVCVECKLFLTLLTVNIAKDGYMYSGHRAVIFGQEGGVRINKDPLGEPFWLSRSSLVKSCSIRVLYLVGNVPMVQDSAIGPIIIANDAMINTYENVNFVCVNGCTVVGDLTSWGIQCSNGMATLNIGDSRIESFDVGIYIGNGNILYSPQNILIGSCNKAIYCANVIDFNYGVARFRNNVECINIVGSAKFKYCPETYSIYGTGNTYDVVIINDPIPAGLSFAQLATRTVASNFLTGACISYYDATSMQYVQSRAAVASDIGAEPTLVKGNLTEASSDVLTITDGYHAVIGTGTTIQVKKASAVQDGYLSKIDFTAFSSGGHNPVTLNISAVTSGLSLNNQELSARAATTALDGYLKHGDWNIFYNKEPAVTKGNLTESLSGVLTFGGVTTGNIIGSGTSIQVKKASAAQDGYLAKGDFTIFNNKENVQTKGSISETASSVLTIVNGASSTVGPNVTIQAKKASAIQDGYLGKNDFTSFTNSIHNPVTLNTSAVTSGLSLNNQELSARAATTALDGYLKHADWATFYGKEVPLTFSNSLSRSTNNVTLANDVYSPGVNQFYGTSRAGIKGWGTRNIANHFTVGQVGSDCDFTPVLGYGAIYTAVETAIAMGASVSNQYEIIVYPGIYPEPPINVPIGINIKSSDNRIDTAFVVAINPNADLFTMIGGFICGLNVMGVSGVTNCLFRCATPMTFNVLHGVSFSTCSNGIIVSDGAQLIVTNVSMLIGAPAMNIGVGITVTGVGSYIGISGGFAAAPSILLPAYYPANPIQTCFRAADNGELFLSAVSMRVAYNDPTCDVIFADTNAFVFVSGGEFTGCNNCIHIGASAVGLGTQVLAQGVNFTNNILDVFNESSIGKVFTNQSVDIFNYSGLPNSILAGIIQVRDENLMRVVGSFRYQYASGRDVDFADFFADYTSTGVCGGGEITLCTGLFINVSEGDGWVRRGPPFNDSAWASWDEYLNLPLVANTTNYIGYNYISRSIETTTSVPGYGNFILLSTIITGNSSIRFYHKTRNYLTAPMEQLRTYLQSTRKVALDSGLIVEVGTANRKFSISSGSYYLGLDLISYDGYADAYFSYFRGTNGVTETADQYQLNADSYDFNGTLTTMIDGYYRADTILLTSDGNISVIYGNAEYSTQLAAESSLMRNVPTFIEPSCFPIAKAVVKKSFGIKSFIDLRPQPGTNTGSGGGGSAGVTAHSALSGLNADDHKQYLLVSGSRAMGNDLNMGGNQITNVGNVDGIDVHSHGSRHNPGGFDPLSTGTPVHILLGAATAPGSASTYALSDHQHGLVAVAGIASDGYLKTTDWNLFYNKENAQTKGSISETASSVLTIVNGTSSTVGPNVTIQAKKASAAQDGYLGKNDFTSFTNSIHNSVTLNASAVTGGLSLNTQELAFRAATTAVDGYLKHADWNTFYNKEPAVSKGNLTESGSSILTFGGTLSNNVIGSGTSIQVKKASAAQDGYLAKGDFTIFNNKENAQTKGSISETASSVLTIVNGASSTVGPNVTIQAKKASTIQDGYLGKNDFTSFTNSIHNPVTLNTSAVTGGLSLNTQELSARAATTAVDGYLKHADWNTFYNKEPAVSKGNLTEAVSGILTITGGSGAVIGVSGTSIQVKKASAAQDGYLAKDDFTTFSNKFNDPMSARGDIIYRNSSNITAALHLGADGYVLTSNGTNLIWGSAADPTRIESGNTYAYVRDTGSDGYFAIVTEGTERIRAASDGYTGFGVISPSSTIDVNGNIEVGSINWFYFGGPTTEGTVRMGKSGNDFVIQQYKSNVWVLGTKVIFP